MRSAKGEPIHEVSRTNTNKLSCSFVWLRGSRVSTQIFGYLYQSQKTGTSASLSIFVAAALILTVSLEFKL